MACEECICDDTALPEAAPGTTARRAPGRPLPAARIRPALNRLRRRRNAARALIVPTVRYRDVAAAVAWLCAAFGMEEHRVVAGENGVPCYAELKFGGSLLMIAPIEDTAFGKLMVQPDEVGGVETQVCYLFVEDARAHYARAKAAGAGIVLDIEEEANSGRGYSCRDPEGHVWNFGTYDPWQNRRAQSRNPHPRREQHGLAALLLLALAVVLTSQTVPPPPSARAGAVVAETRIQEPLAGERQQREAAERSAKAQREREAQVQKAALQAAERSAAEARTQLAGARGAQQKAEREAAVARAQLEETRNAKQAAERNAAEMRQLLKAAEKDAKEARAQAALEQGRHLASARARGRVASFRFSRPLPRVWCYNPNVPNSAPKAGSRLSGFCRY